MNISKLGLPIVAVSALLATGCEVDQTQEARLPDVDVSGDAGAIPEYEVVKVEEGHLPSVDVDVEGGQLPTFKVEGPTMTVGKKDVSVTVPDVDVDVHTEKKTFTVPTIDIDLPNDEDDSPNH